MKFYLKALCMAAIISMAFMGSLALAQSKVFKVGVVGPFTGPAAKTGEEFRASAEVAFDGVNYQIGDYKIELVWIDSQSDPAKGSNAYTEAIEKQGIGASFANWHSSVAMAMMDIAAQYKIPHIPGLGASSMITDKFNGDRAKFNGYYLKSWPNPEKMFQGYIDFVDEIVKSGKWKPKSKKIALFAEDTDWGHSAMAAFKKGFGSSGQWEIVSEDLFPATQTDFYQMLGRYKSQDVALIAGVTTYPAMGALVKQADETKLGALIISDRLSEVGNWYEVTGKSSNYLLDMMPTLSTEQAKAWFNTVKEKYNISPSPVAGGLSHDSAKLLIKVMKRANEKYGELTSEGIANVVRDEVVPGTLTLTAADGAVIMKEYKYTEETAPDPLVGPDYYFFPIVQCMDGQALVVYPEYAKQTDFQLPK